MEQACISKIIRTFCCVEVISTVCNSLNLNDRCFFHTSFLFQGIDSFFSQKLTPHILPICAFHLSNSFRHIHRLEARNSLRLIQILLQFLPSPSRFPLLFWELLTLYFQSQCPNTQMPKKFPLSSLSTLVSHFTEFPQPLTIAGIHNLTPWQHNIQALLLWCFCLYSW